MREHLPDARVLSVHEVLQWCRGGSRHDDASPAVLDAAKRCVDGLAEARAREGSRLAAVLAERIVHLRGLADAAEPLVPAAVSRQQQRFIERWNEALDKVGGAGHGVARSSRRSRVERSRRLRDPDRRRRGAGAAAFAPGRDCPADRQGGEIGKRLEFLIQELLREANTLGSKSTSMEMTSISVDMKVAIEQLREQVQNVE